MKGKERKSIYIALFWPRWYTQSAQAWITQFYLQITPCLPFLRERSPDVTTTAIEAADIQLQLTTHLSTPKGWVGLVGWPIADGLPTLVVIHQLQVERRIAKGRQPKTDVLPLDHATNLGIQYVSLVYWCTSGLIWFSVFSNLLSDYWLAGKYVS